MPARFTIRRKILAGLVLTVACLAVLTAISYSNLLQIEQRIQVLAGIDAVEEAIMEVRREGKQYLFYEAAKEHAAVSEAVTRAVTLLSQVREGLIFPEPQAMARGLASRLERYRESIEAVSASSGADRLSRLTLKSNAHMLSMNLENEIMTLSATVRARIGYISSALRAQLLAAALGAGVLFALIGYGISVHVLGPLNTIERTARQIGQGHFKAVPVRDNHDEIRDLQEAFNTMVAELKARQEQLVQSRKLSSIGTLSAGIAHQVNNPLNNISLSAQVLEQALADAPTPATKKALDNITRETERARDIVRGLLDFARQSEFSLRPVPLAEVVRNAVGFASAELPPGVAIEVELPESLQLDLDPQRMSEALLNIISNGVQAIGDRPGKVRVTLDAEPPKGMVTLLIEDSGCGIPPEHLQRIFDPFFTSKEVGRGTGLGLSIGYGIIEECGGEVRVESRPGQGSRFFIDLPLPQNGFAAHLKAGNSHYEPFCGLPFAGAGTGTGAGPGAVGGAASRPAGFGKTRSAEGRPGR